MVMHSLRERMTRDGADDTAAVAERLRTMSHRLTGPDDLDPLLDRIGDARFVLLGEATHGTHEYYTWRAAISRRLIEEKGFSFIAVEGDWPDCYHVNRYVKGIAGAGASAPEVLHAFTRWPTWMWANEEIVALAEWLCEHNDRRPADERIGFYGLDVYSLWGSIEAVVDYLKRVDPASVGAAYRAFQCFAPYGEDVQEYARATQIVPTSCADEVLALLLEVRQKAPTYQEDSREAFFSAEQNALVAVGAEQYYRAMVRGGAASWNVRDQHMADTLDRLMQHHGPTTKAIVWEHNTHIGDARATDMAGAGMVNLGQLARERHWRDGVVLVGFGSHRGSVIASDEWGAPMTRMTVPPARPGSYEDILHGLDASDHLLIFSPSDDGDPLLEPRGHRAIGVVYNPAHERYGNYVPTILPLRYDAFLYLDETSALHPLHLEPHAGGESPETYPFGV
jgi:erythromycin esterase-like protein